MITPITATFPALNFPKEVDYPTQEDWTAFSSAAELNYGILSGEWSDKSEEFKAQTNNLALEIQAIGENAFNAITFDNIAQLKLNSNMGRVDVLGYYTKGDGGGGTFYWDSTSTETDNGGTIIQATGINTGRWKRVFSGAVNVKWFGAVGDGVTNDIVSLQSSINEDTGTVTLPERERYLATSLTNDKGVEFDGYGEIVKTVAGGFDKLNSYSDKNQYIFGREYLAAFQNLIAAQFTTPTRQPIVVFSGDSTTAGDGTTVGYRLNELFANAAEAKGVQTAYGINSINRGQSGQATFQWVDTHLAGDLAVNPDLLVLRWGINDPGWLKDETTPPLDGGKDYPNRRDEVDFINSLREGLTIIRSSRSLSSLSIILMMPNSVYDTPNGRDALYFERIVDGVKKAARDFQCTFIDTYAMFRDTKNLANLWMDDPFADGRGIHPNNVMNTMIVSKISDIVFPSILTTKYGVTNFTNICGAEDLGDVNRDPGYYKFGITISRASSAGFPFDGNIITIRSIDQTVIQYNYGYLVGKTSMIAFRIGRAIALWGDAASWDEWVYIGSRRAIVGDVPGFDASTAYMNLDSRTVTSAGYITQDIPTIIPANTIIGTIPDGYKPTIDSHYNNVICWDGVNFYSIVARFDVTSITLLYSPPVPIVRIYINAVYSI